MMVTSDQLSMGEIMSPARNRRSERAFLRSGNFSPRSPALNRKEQFLQICPIAYAAWRFMLNPLADTIFVKLGNHIA
jgi:hypothetical protein